MTIFHRICSSALLAALFIVLTSAAWAVDDKPCSSDSDLKAVEFLKTQVRQDKRYASWAKEQCLWFYPEHCDAQNVEVAIRELHTEACGGDLNTGPVVDRFRVFKSSSRIDWFNYLDDEYVEYAKAHAIE